MLKNILNLEGAQKLTKDEQKTVIGGYVPAGEECVDSSFYVRYCNEADCLSMDGRPAGGKCYLLC
jgi:hypothetical protein